MSSGGALAISRDHGGGAASAVDAMLHAAPHRGTACAAVTSGPVTVGVTTTFDDTSLAQRQGLVAGFVGTLDNAAEVRRQLAEPDAVTAAELALAAVATWGPVGAAARMRGAYAVAGSDGQAVWCFRDHHGANALFYEHERDRFRAASEAKQVAAVQPGGPRPDVDALEAGFYNHADDRTPSYFLGVQRLGRSRVLVVDGTAARVERYWAPEKLLESSRLGVDEAVEGFLDLLEQAVTRPLRGHDAVSLSGGIDSTTIAAAAAHGYVERYGMSLGALSALFPDHPEVDERPYIDAVVDALGLDLQTIVPTAKPLDDLETWVGVLDGPVFSVSVPELSEHYGAAAARGYRSLLMGDAGEFVYDARHHLLGHLLLHGRLAALTRVIRGQRAWGRRWTPLIRMLLVALVPARVTTAVLRRRGENHLRLPAWIHPAKMGGLGHRADLAIPNRQRWAYLQTAAFVGPILTGEADEIIAACHGLRIRRPLMDVDLWEFALSLRAETKFPAGESKDLVRRAMRGRLPDLILDRRDKTHFNAHAESTIDYPALERWITKVDFEMPGVDYGLLRRRLDERDMGMFEQKWAQDLACAHAFMARW